MEGDGVDTELSLKVFRDLSQPPLTEHCYRCCAGPVGEGQLPGGGPSALHAFAPALVLLALGASPAAAQRPGDGLNIQEPGTRVFWTVGATSSSEYRDQHLSDHGALTVGAGVAAYGFAGSFWAEREANGHADLYEALLGYSYKLPVVDAHLGYAVCGVDRSPSGCPDGPRLTLTTNAMPHTTIEATFDYAGEHRHGHTFSVTRDIVERDAFRAAIRAGIREEETRLGSYGGVSLRAIGSYRLDEDTAIDLAIGGVWNLRNSVAAHGRSGAIVKLSLVGRY